jgi:hypothetical protein
MRVFDTFAHQREVVVVDEVSLIGLARPVQNGEDEGILSLTKVPSKPAEAALIRHYVGLRKRPIISPEQGGAASENRAQKRAAFG